jgi:signal transduction histidine kinase
MTLIEDRSRRLVDHFEKSLVQSRQGVAALRVAALRWILVFLVLAPLLAMVVGVYVHRSVARPVARLQAGAVRIAQGDLDARIEVDTPDEFGDLARQLNAMTQALQHHQRQLVQHEKLAGMGRLAAGVAHEINNPLTVILGYVRLLGRSATGQGAADLRIIEEESLHAKAIVDGLLDLARPTNVDCDRVDLRELADDVIEGLRENGVLKGVTVTVTGTATVSGSSRKLREVVANLVKNASEAAQPGGRVEIDIGTGAGLGRIVVRDTGQGLSREALERVFEPFFSSKARGTGLGLAASRGIIQAHRGTIEVANTPSGGARFEVRLPAATGAEKA